MSDNKRGGIGAGRGAERGVFLTLKGSGVVWADASHVLVFMPFIRSPPLGPNSLDVVVICLHSPLPPWESFPPRSSIGAWGIVRDIFRVPGRKTPLWG